MTALNAILNLLIVLAIVGVLYLLYLTAQLFDNPEKFFGDLDD
jgi:threonine/homoserine/homoserine lactone efflux protein